MIITHSPTALDWFLNRSFSQFCYLSRISPKVIGDCRLEIERIESDNLRLASDGMMQVQIGENKRLAANKRFGELK